jgi:hypothetical protein
VTIFKQHICLPILFFMHKQNTLNWFLLCSWSSSSKKKITVSFLSTRDQLVNLFTKLLVVARFCLLWTTFIYKNCPLTLRGSSINQVLGFFLIITSLSPLKTTRNLNGH